MTKINIEDDLLHDLNEMDENDDPRAYRARLVSVLMLQRRGKSDDIIEKRIERLNPEHRMVISFSCQDNSKIILKWKHVPKIGNIVYPILVDFDILNNNEKISSEEWDAYQLLDYLQSQNNPDYTSIILTIKARLDWLKTIS